MKIIAKLTVEMIVNGLIYGMKKFVNRGNSPMQMLRTLLAMNIVRERLIVKKRVIS